MAKGFGTVLVVLAMVGVARPGHAATVCKRKTLQSHLGWAPPTGSPSDLRYGFEFLVFDGVTVDGTWAVTAP